MSCPALFVTLTAADGRRAEVVAALERTLATVEGEEGTQRFVIAVDDADPAVVRVYEQYADDAALAVHGSSPSVAQLFADLADLMAAPPVLAICRVVGGKGV